MDNNPISCHLLGRLYGLDGKRLQAQYKDFLSDFHSWDQKEHAEDWMLFADNIGPALSIDETSLTNGELYTIVTNKEARGGKRAIVAMVKGTQATQIMAVLERIPVHKRNKVREVTMDMAANMIKAIRRCFTNAERVIDRFHVQKLAYDAVQESRIKYRWEALEAENKALETAKKDKKVYEPEVFTNGDTLKQLLARSRYLLFKHSSKWQLPKRNEQVCFSPDIRCCTGLITCLSVWDNCLRSAKFNNRHSSGWLSGTMMWKRQGFLKAVCRSQTHF